VISYFLRDGREAIASIPLTVTPALASITAPATAVAGSTIEVGWTGPNYDDDYIGIGRVGASSSNAWQNWTYTRTGNPLQLLIPAEPGDYLIRYYVNQDRTVLAEVPISVSQVAASLTAPATATAGSTIEVGWTGPNYDDDYIGIGRVGASSSGGWEKWTYTSRGNPATLDLPETPGDYLIRYYLNQDRTVIAEVPITLQ
jgi:Ca-activated chloride channel family protein